MLNDMGGSRVTMDPGVQAMKTGMGIGMVIGLIFGLAYPILVMVLLTRPGAKASCTN
jgi:hypothetical protein